MDDDDYGVYDWVCRTVLRLGILSWLSALVVTLFESIHEDRWRNHDLDRYSVIYRSDDEDYGMAHLDHTRMDAILSENNGHP